MPSENFFYTGADATIIVNLFDADGNIFAVPPTATVTAALVDQGRDVLISPIKTVLSSDESNNWPLGVVAFSLTDGDTAGISAGVYDVEVKIVDTKVWKARICFAAEAVETVLS